MHSTPEVDFELPPEKKGGASISLGILQGAAAAITPEVIRLKLAHEKLSLPTDPRNIFEPGDHLKGHEDCARMTSRFLQSDPDAHIWSKNPELEKRLASYSPQVLTIDSLSPTPAHNELDKAWIWLSLPARPQKLNPKGLYVLWGDAAHLQKIAASVNYDYYRNTDLNRLLNHDSSITAYDNYYRRQKIISIAALIGFLGINYNNINLSSNKEQIKTEYPKGITRRDFLKKLASGALAAIAIMTFSKLNLQLDGVVNAAHSTTWEDKKFWQSVASYTDDISDWVWIDGRTALLIAKHEDAMESLREANYLSGADKGAIVMGYTHAHKANLYMRDKTARNDAILAYAKDLNNLFNNFFFDNYNLSTFQKSKLTANLLNYLAEIEITHVSDPGIPKGTSLKDYVNENIQPVKTFKSKQVEEAIKSLRFIKV